MEKAEAIELINTLIADIDGIRGGRVDFTAWRTKCRAVLDRIYGKDSTQIQELFNVNFQFYGISQIGDSGPHRRAYQQGLDSSREVLRSFIWEIESLGLAPLPSAQSAISVERTIALVCNRFHSFVSQLRHRHDDRPTIDVTDEYDAQDVLHALLRLYFDDVRAEEWTPSYAGAASRVDFLLKQQSTVIEVKKTRKGLDAKRIGEQLVIDIARYQSHPDCKQLFCFVYDPDGRIFNPAGIENDLSRKVDELSVNVIIAPKQ